MESRRAAGWGLVGGGLVAFVLYHAIGQRFLDGFTLDLGSVGFPTPRYLAFLLIWVVFGGLCAILLTAGVASAIPAETRARWAAMWAAIPHRQFVVVSSLAVFGLALALRYILLHGVALTDDESAYRFMAQCLASGRLSAPSPPMKLFFDRAFMINDGQLYAKYFLGWPALMVPGVWLGFRGMNAFYVALTVPAVFLTSRRLLGERWAKLVVLLFITSPMIVIAASTEMSHTACFMALAWLSWFALRARDHEAPLGFHIAVAASFSLAFFIRPTAALAVGGPVLVVWAVSLARQRGAMRLRRAVAFGATAAVFAAAFLTVNQLQNGSPWTTAYEKELQYAKANGFRFTTVEPDEVDRPPELDLSLPLSAHLAKTGAAILRLNFSLLGWPCGLLAVLLSGFGRRARLLWAVVAAYLLLHFFSDNPGIDSFGPVHYFELSWPLLLLTGLGLKRLERWASEHGLQFVGSMLVCLIGVTLVGYSSVRLAALRRMAEDIRAPLAAVVDERVQNAVVFTYYPLSNYCRSRPTRHFKLWRPNNDPDLNNDILWVNHISLEANRQLMTHFPDRQGFVQAWDTSCNVRLVGLDALQPNMLPDADGTRR